MFPQEFDNRIQLMLTDQYDSFIKSFEDNKYQAIRINTLKCDNTESVTEKFSATENVPWEPNGFYYSESETPGKHPYHEAGVYYIQEPSALAPVPFLEVQEGERVLDLCAAPGGKSTQIAAAMNGKGIFIANEISPQRAKILSLNIERLGVQNCLVLNEDSGKLANVFPEYFDRILVDAPCSGEGMFRKNDVAISEWSLENVSKCEERQIEILDNAAAMLAPGGRIVYSTCTFAPAENEGSIISFLERHPDFKLLDVHKYEGMASGNAEFISYDKSIMEDELKELCSRDSYKEEIKKTVRLWPHLLKGEGHYLAVLEKEGDIALNKTMYVPNGSNKTLTPNDLKAYREFEKEFLNIKLEGDFILFGEQLYLTPKGMPGLKGLKVLRPGLHIGTMKKDRFEPSHALALCLKKDEAVNVYDIPSDSAEIRSYLNGQTIRTSGNKGWHLITTDGYSIGWGKLAGSVLKNHYPKGLRINY